MSATPYPSLKFVVQSFERFCPFGLYGSTDRKEGCVATDSRSLTASGQELSRVIKSAPLLLIVC